MIDRTKKYGLLVGLLSIIALCIFLSNYSASYVQNSTTVQNSQQSSTPVMSIASYAYDNTTTSSPAKIIISGSATLPDLNFTQLNQGSKLIVIGTVKEILPAKWNTPDGKRRGDTIETLGSDDTMYTDIIVSVDKYLKSPLDQKEVRVRIQGGEDEVAAVVVDTEPSFKESEKVLLYLREDTSPLFKNYGPENYLVSGHYLGKFTLTDDGLAVRPYEYLDQKELLDAIERGYEPEIKSFEEARE